MPGCPPSAFTLQQQSVRTYHKFLPLLALASVCTLGVACDDDEVDPNQDINNRLEGDWEVESYTLDGVEIIGAGVSRYDIEFEKTGSVEGDFEQLVIFSSGETAPGDGEYEIRDGGAELRLEYRDGGSDTYNIEVDGDDLTLEATLDGVREIIRAERD